MNHLITRLIAAALWFAPSALLAQDVALPEALADPVADFREAATLHVEATVLALTADGSPRAQRLAAVLAASRLPRPACASDAPSDCTRQPAHGRVRELLETALKANPDDVLLHWIAAQDPSLPPQQRQRLVGRLAVLEPSNAAVWLLRLRGAAQDGAAAADAVLAAAADAQRHSLYTGERMRAYLDAFETLPLPAAMRGTLPGLEWTPDDATARAVQALMSWLSDPIPPAMLQLMRECREPPAGRRAHCLTIAETLLARSDSSLAVAMGADLLGRHADPERQAEARARRRQVAWWQAQSGLAELDAADAPERLRVVFAAWREPGAGELSVLRAQAQDRGLPLAPPPEWAPARQP
ncbi:MAG TPA: hypothetical protein VFG21_11775 [Xanthomonadaceae bacterium]|nr:hypothetical protein [Xanthomonadaceae bacterium]